jgi:hypothetical protein
MLRFCSRSLVGFQALALAGLPAASLAGGAPTARVIHDFSVQSELRFVDLRWSESLLAVDGRGAVYQLPLEPAGPPKRVLEAGTPSPWVLHLAASPDLLVVGGLAFAFTIQDRRNDELTHHFDFEYLGGIDVRGSELLAAGIRRDGESLASDGMIAFRASVADSGELSWRPLLPAADGAGARRLQDCAMLDLMRVRFLGDGGSVVVPGAYPNVFVYDSDGALERVIPSSELGLEEGCEVPGAIADSIGSDTQVRARWLNARRLVDEIIELPAGPALVVREVVADRVRWSLLPLLETAGAILLPFSAAPECPTTRVRADARGSSMAFLLYDGALMPREQACESRFLIVGLETPPAQENVSSWLRRGAEVLRQPDPLRRAMEGLGGAP